MQTKAAVVYERDKPVTVETLTLDDPKANEVLLRMGAAGVCHSDLSVINGAIALPPPIALGHEGAGIVERIGEGVTYVKPGDHVILSFATYCGECAICQTKRVCLCNHYETRPGYLLDDTCRLHNAKGVDIAQMARIGTMSELAVVPENALIKIDPEYPLDRAALVGCGVTTGVGAVLNTAQVEAGSTVAVIGTGGVGLNVIQGAAIADAAQIIAVDLNPSKLEIAKQFGATHTVNASGGDPVAAVRELTDGMGVDYAFEVIGYAKTIEQAYEMTRLAGTAVVVGLAHGDEQISLPASLLTYTERRLIGCFYGSSQPRVHMLEYLRYYDEGKLKLDELISARYKLDEINVAFDALTSGQNVRGMILFDS